MSTSTTQSTSGSNRSVSQSPSASGRSYGEGELQPVDDLVDYVTTYARQNPSTAALWCFGIGFIVGWKLKPW